MDRTAYRCNLEYREAVRTQMLTLAKEVVSGNIGIVVVARELSGFRDGVEPEIGRLLDVFVGLNSETDALPVGPERSLWNAEALARKDEEIRAIEQQWRDRAVNAAMQLARLLEQSP
jgi:hypothetical protein